MSFRNLVAAVFLAAASVVCSASNYIVPTTTLVAETSNNTSAANSFSTQSNGNRGAGNISKVDVHSLLYAGASTKVYAHLLLWFGQSNHMNIGYSSTDPAQIKRQITDMISRGIDGVVIDWYGTNNSIDQATQLVMAEAEQHPGFTFAIMVDQGAIQWFSCPGCDPQQALTADLQYVEQNYFTSPAYMTVNGQPLVTDFAIDQSYTIDWNALNASLSTHPLFVFQNNTGFSHVLSDGGYSWVIPTTTDYGMSYLTNFYDTGLSFPAEQTVAATYKGFNDTLASWGQNRVMGQQCGQTWLQTFSLINSLYSSTRQVPYLQLVTWNDYEEGTEVESGIDNCMTVSASVSSNTLNWNVTGNENTLDHYVAYISADGQNLMPLTQTTPGNRSVNLCSFPIPGGSYKLFVQAVGKPAIANQMTSALTYTPACATPVPASFSLNASPSSVTIPAGTSGTLAVAATSTSGSFNNPITLSCTALPSNMSCSFSPVTLTPGSGTATSTLTISALAAVGMNHSERSWKPIYAALTLPFGIGGFAFIASGTGKRLRATMALVALCLGMALAATSCGGGSSATTGAKAAAKSYSVTIDATSTGTQQSTTITVIVP
jgi:glycosyl hydrolase family 71